MATSAIPGNGDDPACILTELKVKRARHKGNVTRVINQMKVLMKDPDNRELVADLSTRLDERLSEFMTAQRAFHQLLIDEDDIKKELHYQNVVVAEVARIRQQFESYQRGTTPDTDDDQVEDSVQPSDSVSHTSKQQSSAASSTATVTSKTSNARLRAIAEIASLEVEAAAENQRRSLESEEHRLELRHREEQLKLSQRRRQMELQTKIAKAEAVERTYSVAQEQETHSVRFMQSINPLCVQLR